MALYFEKFPLYYYKGILCKNIMQRNALRNNVKTNSTMFYDVAVEAGDRPDTVAHRLYGDQYYDWLLYLVNDIVDPYSEWYLSDQQLDSYIKRKYGSVTEATETIIHFRNNWSQDDRQLSTAAYEALTSNLKKYWVAVDDENGQPLYYTRKREDTIINTNYTLQLTLNSTTGIVVGKRLTQTVNGVVAGSGMVKYVGANYVILHCIQGSFNNNQNVTSNNVSTNLISQQNLGYHIEINELSYWVPVSSYDYEVQINESKKNIRALMPANADAAIKMHEDLVA